MEIKTTILFDVYLVEVPHVCACKLCYKLTFKSHYHNNRWMQIHAMRTCTLHWVRHFECIWMYILEMFLENIQLLQFACSTLVRKPIAHITKYTLQHSLRCSMEYTDGYLLKNEWFYTDFDAFYAILCKIGPHTSCVHVSDFIQSWILQKNLIFINHMNEFINFHQIYGAAKSVIM